MEIPASYEFINQYNGTRSPTGTVEFDKSTSYFFRCLYERLLSVFDFQIPEEWNKNYFLNVLYGCGYVGIVPTALPAANGTDRCTAPCSVSGQDRRGVLSVQTDTGLSGCL